MIENLTSQMKATLYKRASSPLFSSFCISWLICNYRILILFFSSLEPRYKIYEIELLTGKEGAFWSLYLIPAFVAVFYATLFPHLENGIYKIWLSGNRKLINSKAESDGETKLSQEQVNNLKAELYSYKQSYLDLLDSNNSEIKELKEKLSSQVEDSKKTLTEKEVELNLKYGDDLKKATATFNKQITSLTQSYEDANAKLNEARTEIERLMEKVALLEPKNVDLDDLKYKILDLLVNSASFTYPKHSLLQQYSGTKKLEVDAVINGLVNSQYVKIKNTINQKELLEITEIGKRFYQSLSASN
ncbi:hypothetical protein [Shewanella sp. MM_2022_3]|uniref:hypothetical protein n=1 Tax=Shewanella sp. MM_2022_3 TaxID=2923280 RepID=UPI001F4C2D6A|nr:hypothetical protein [Shewanella sp. MM_2022_3]MCH7422637.1 hypothetical protein [Shewanella sp. MM_2022_3]